MDKIIELEAVLKAAAELAAELHTANNIAKNPSPHVAVLRSRVLAAQESLVWHRKHIEANPEPATETKA